MSKNTLTYLLLAVLLLIGAFYFYDMYRNSPAKVNDGDNNSDNSEIVTDSEGEFSLTAEYMGDSNWEYTVEGQLPTPCHSAEVDALVAESFPEQVTVRVTLNEPDDAVVCVQVIKDFEYDGEFSASEGATVQLSVSEE